MLGRLNALPVSSSVSAGPRPIPSPIRPWESSAGSIRGSSSRAKSASNGFGIPPDKNGDYAFLLHMLKSLKSTGKAAVILPHGVLFRGGAEGGIRTRIVRQGYIKGIIGLPANLF